MKNRFSLTARMSSLMLLGLALLAATVPARAATTTPCVSGATLSGHYGMLAHGQTLSGVPKYLNGWVYFNGACVLTGTLTIGEDSTVTSFATVSGTYNGNGDGTFTITLTLPGAATAETYNVSYSPVFNEILGVESDTTAVAAIDFKPQIYPSTGPHNVYTNASLKGTFAASCIGGFDSDLNYVTFDGNTAGFGHIGGIDDSNDYASFSVATYTGLYTVGSQGVFGGQVAVSNGYIVGFSGVIDNNLNEIQYVYSSPGANAYDFEYCVAKRVK